MDINDLLGFYTNTTSQINYVSGEISTFAEQISDEINLDFTVPKSTEFPTNLTRFPDPLSDFSDLPLLTSEYPDFNLDTEDYKSIISELRHTVDTLLNTLQGIVPDLDQLSLSPLPDPPTTDINPEYPSLTLDFGDIPSPPNIPDLTIPTIPNVEDISVDQVTYSAEDLAGYFDSLADYISQIRETLQDVEVEVGDDFPDGSDVAPAHRTLSDWLTYDLDPSQEKLELINLDGLTDMITGDSIEAYRYYVLPDGFVEAVMDFAESIQGMDVTREAPLSYLDSLRLAREVEEIVSEANERGFNEDVIDEGVAYDLTLHRIKTHLELAEKKSKVLSTYNAQMWKAVDRKPKLADSLSSWILVSYYSLVDGITKLYQVRIKTIQSKLETVDKAVRLNMSRLQTLAQASLVIFTNIESQIRNLASRIRGQMLEVESETVMTQAEALEAQAVVKKIAQYVSQIRLAEAALREMQAKLRLYEVKAGLFGSQIQFEALKNNQVILENQNDILSTMTQFMDYDRLVEQYRLLANIQDGKLQVFNDYVSYLGTVLDKLVQNPDIVVLKGKIQNLQAQIRKFLIDRQAKDRIVDTWMSSLGDRWAVDEYDYRKLMQKIVYDAESSVTFAETMLTDRIAKASGKFNTLGEYYSRKVQGALSAAHTVVGITNRILDE